MTFDPTSTGSVDSKDLADYVVAHTSQAVNVVHATATTNSNTTQLNLVIDALIAAGFMAAS